MTIESLDKCLGLLTRALPHIKKAHDDAESRHDEMGGELHMDHGQFEIIQDTEEWMRSLEDLFDGTPS